jgi:hypothetical protein
MKPPDKAPECSAIACACQDGFPLEELEARLEAQRLSPLDSTMSCYTDLCPGDCSTHCTAGYSGCTDLCGCDGAQCIAECGSLCVADSCVVDILGADHS